MPKFTYSAAKGILQESGSGFFVTGAPMIENQQSLTAAAGSTTIGTDTDALTAYGATTITAANTASQSGTLGDGSYVGQMKYFFFDLPVGTGACTITVTSAASGNGTLLLNADNDMCSLVWTGAVWKIIVDSNTIAS